MKEPNCLQRKTEEGSFYLRITYFYLRISQLLGHPKARKLAYNSELGGASWCTICHLRKGHAVQRAHHQSPKSHQSLACLSESNSPATPPHCALLPTETASATSLLASSAHQHTADWLKPGSSFLWLTCVQWLCWKQTYELAILRTPCRHCLLMPRVSSPLFSQVQNR